MKQVFRLSILVALLVGLSGLASAQDDMMMSPGVMVSDQVSLNGHVMIDMVVSDGPGFIVIHIDNGGAPGPVIGYRAVNDGASYNVAVPIDAPAATPVLYAMLHTDTGEVGVYEFGTVQGADGPVRDGEGNVITPAFNVAIIRAYDQFLADNTFTAASVTIAEDGFLVIHADNEGTFGPVIGYTAISAGTTTGVVVELDAMGITGTLWPMLHVDTGVLGEYEFGTVQGADGPVVIGGVVAVTPVTTDVPAVRVADQIVTDSVVAESVLSEGLGWLVIHVDNDGAPGPVIGAAQVQPGTNVNVVVEVDPMGVTPVLWPMLHVDTGVEGEYEFGTVQGADGPVRVNDQVLTFPINAAPAIEYSGTLDGTMLTIPFALIDAQGWLVIHAEADGSFGPVIGATPLIAGANFNIVIELDEMGITETLWPMLHVDTGELGVYEFGTVQGADGPVIVGGAVATGPMIPEMSME